MKQGEAVNIEDLRAAGNGLSPPAFKAKRTDLANAGRLAHAYRSRLRYVRERRMWLSWDGKLWKPDATGDAERAAKRTVRQLLAEAAQIEDEDECKRAVGWAIQSQSDSRLKALLSQATTEPEIALAADAIDRDGLLLTCANGTLDLRTAELRDHDPADLITRGTSVAYNPEAKCSLWLRFLDEVFAGDAELIEFIRRLVGYCLTGQTKEHILAVFHGAGCNGKSTFIGVLKHLLGDYAVTAAFDTFVRQRNGGGPRNDLARLHRARLVSASESGEGRHLDEATVKEITGGDTITARFLYGEYFEFQPEFKLILITNYLPRVAGDDDAIWRRLRLVPFAQSFLGREDLDLPAKLAQELPGILAWAVGGCLDWQREGLGLAEAVSTATHEYRAEEDLLQVFLGAYCAEIAGERVLIEVLRSAYETYCEEVGEEALTGAWLGRRLAKRGIRRKRETTGERRWFYDGLRLK
jgi:putative DNA primase/helicase